MQCDDCGREIETTDATSNGIHLDCLAKAATTTDCPNPECVAGYVTDTCAQCNGSGEGHYSNSYCHQCHGTGQWPESCPTCDGEGVIPFDPDQDPEHTCACCGGYVCEYDDDYRDGGVVGDPGEAGVHYACR